MSKLLAVLRMVAGLGIVLSLFVVWTGGCRGPQHARGVADAEGASGVATSRGYIARQASASGEGERRGGPAGRAGARYAIRQNGEPPRLSRAAAQNVVATRGVFGALGAPADGAPDPGSGAVSPFGGLMGDELGDAFGYGGLGASGTGMGGGGNGAGTIGLGSMGTIGRGSGTGQGYGTGSGRGLHGGFMARASDPPPERPVSIDPNGRFATTYRPGAGHLAAFEAALRAGIVPASARQIVGDFAAQYAPTMEAPTTQALAMRVDLERTAIAPAGGALRLRLALRSADSSAAGRPRMSVHLVVDTSGSMSGDSIENARRAATALVGRLDDNDHFSLTRFSDEAEVVVSAGRVGDRRRAIAAAVAALEATGGTNIFDGLRVGYRQAAADAAGEDSVRIVMLVSDGRATSGNTDGSSIAQLAIRAFQANVQTSTFGVGTDYDGPLMATIADRGAGGYYYVRDSHQIASALGTELDARLQPVAQAVEVRVRLRPDVVLTETYGSRRLDNHEAEVVRTQEVAIDRHAARRERIARDRQDDREGGMRFFIPGFARHDAHVILLGLNIPAGVGERPIASIELRYKDRIQHRNVTVEQPVMARYADSDAASVASADLGVVRTVQAFDAGDTLMRAALAVERGDRPRAIALLTERADILRAAATRWSEPRFAHDAGRVERFRGLIQGTSPMSEPMVLALLLDTSARTYMH